jgi:oligopeptide/dipeptide ABC transporter ATP-binding protein
MTPLLEVVDLVRHFPLRGGPTGARRGTVRAVDGVGFAIEPGTTFALVGESGCGKTTTARLVLRLDRPTSGRILVHGKDIGTLRGAGLRAYRNDVQAVFQDPYSSLNPRMRIGDIVGEPLRIQQRPGRRELATRVGELLEQVGLPATAARRHPHQFSGGERQRIALARALSLHPKLLVLDEPVSALDVSIRAQILNLLADLQEQLGLSYLLISHDLAVVEHMSHRVAVMYAGQIVEVATRSNLYDNPLHPYTRALIAAVPRADPDIPLVDSGFGEPPNPARLPSGCRYHPQCPIADASVCPVTEPAARPVRPDHTVACHLVEPQEVGSDTTRGGGERLG